MCFKYQINKTKQTNKQSNSTGVPQILFAIVQCRKYSVPGLHTNSTTIIFQNVILYGNITKCVKGPLAEASDTEDTQTGESTEAGSARSMMHKILEENPKY